MTTYTWPTTGSAFTPESIEWRQRHNVRMSVSELSGAIQTIGLPGMRWGVTLGFPSQSYAERAQLEGFLTRLSGMEHRLQLWDLSRPTPRGTVLTSGVKAATRAQFATTLDLWACGGTRTLLQGDWMQVPTSTGNQLVQVVTDTTSNASGVVYGLEIRPGLRGAITNGSDVVMQQASALFVLSDPELAIPRGGFGMCPPFTVSFTEVFS